MTRREVEKHLPEGYGIDKADGFWYFNGPDCHLWYDTCTYYTRLDDATLNKWLDDFNIMKSEYMEDRL